MFIDLTEICSKLLRSYTGCDWTAHLPIIPLHVDMTFCIIFSACCLVTVFSEYRHLYFLLVSFLFLDVVPADWRLVDSVDAVGDVEVGEIRNLLWSCVVVVVSPFAVLAKAVEMLHTQVKALMT